MASFARGPRGGQLQRRIKDHDADRKAQELKELEQGFNMHFVSTSKPSAKRNPKQPSWLADKIRRACAAEAEGETTEPLWKLLDRETQPETKMKNYSPKLGEEVEVKDKDMPEWRVGVVTATIPSLKVRLLDWEEDFMWDHVRRHVPEAVKPGVQQVPSPPKSENCCPSPVEEAAAPTAPFSAIRPEQTCTCGNRFQREALFCSRCGRQRGCEAINPPVLGKPPRPPAPPARPKNIDVSGIRKSGTSPRMRFTSPAPPEHVLAPQMAKLLSEMGDIVEKTAKLPAICHACGGEHASQDCPGVFTFHMDVCGESLKTSLPSRPGSPCTRDVAGSRRCKPCDRGRASSRNNSMQRNTLQRRTLTKQHWQQLTVPILAEGGEVIDLRPAHECNEAQKGVWQQHTVPILGENGEVIALRAVPDNNPWDASNPWDAWKVSTLPVFDEQGDLVAVQNAGQHAWKQETVPVLGENGEVIALRPAASGKCMWTQKSVPIFGATGQVVAVCPAIGNLQKWEQLTVPLLGENGDVVALRPAGDRYEMPGWGAGANPAPKAKPRNGMASAGCSMRSDRTYVPGKPPPGWKPPPGKAKNSSDDEQFARESPKQDSPLLQSGLWAERARRGRRASESDVDSLKIESINNTIKSPESIRKRGSESVLKLDSLKIGSISNALNSLEKGRGNHPGIGPDANVDNLKVESVSFPVSGVTSLNVSPAPSPDIRVENRVQEEQPNSPTFSEAASAIEKPRRKLCKELSPCASVASMASLNEILHMCNEARMATPDGHMLDVLKDALGPQNSSTCNESLSKLGRLVSMPQAPEADELVTRLKQLPDLWRSTILSMLEQAEACQMPRGPSPAGT